LEIADFTLTTMLDDILKFIYIKMGDIEPGQVDEQDDEDTENRELSKEELAELNNLDILSVE
jgi:hypothetical protein